jgi:hypothetical protein
MTIVITEEVSLADIDEAIRHAYEMLKTDQYGNRMTWQKKQILQNSIDDLLDARLNLVNNGKAFPND